MDEQDAPTDDIQVVLEGDLVYVHFDCHDENGELIESTRSEDGQPLTFEVGAGDLFANEMIKAMDAAVRGLAIGDKARVEAQGNEWNRELLFEVPRDHPEMQRLDGRYKNVGGLAPSLVVELANGSRAVVLDVSEDSVKLDANSMLAGKKLVFEIELVNIEASS